MLIAALTPHSVSLLLVQLTLLLVVARVGALLSRLLGLPAVVGELSAGIVLGPTVFGHFAPGAFAGVFPRGERSSTCSRSSACWAWCSSCC